MPRIKLRPLDSYSFNTQISVRTTDLNYGGHLANDRLLALIHEARVAFLANFGFSELDFADVSLIQADASIVYLKETFAGDILTIEVAAGEPGRTGFRLFYRVSRHSNSETIALVETGMVCFDYDKRKTQRLPERAKKTIFDNKSN